MPKSFYAEPLHIIITREAWSDFYVLTIPADGSSEELELDDVIVWFKDRGANMDAVDAALTQAWNFRRSEIVINKHRVPTAPKLPFEPDI